MGKKRWERMSVKRFARLCGGSVGQVYRAMRALGCRSMRVHGIRGKNVIVSLRGA